MPLPNSIAGSPVRTAVRLLALFLFLVAAFAISQAAFAANSPSSFLASSAGPASSPPDQRLRRADFSAEKASADARQVADWVVVSGDNRSLPFMIVDKANAKLFLFDARGSILAAAPVLLGLARGDDSPPGIGDRPLSMISPAERITPAGRFVAVPGHNLAGQDILWVDYGAAISLHRATDAKPGLTSKSRLDRLATASTLDNRISHGCINVSMTFYDRFIRSTFNDSSGIVYILPETRSARDEFHIPAVNAQVRLSTSATEPGA